MLQLLKCQGVKVWEKPHASITNKNKLLVVRNSDMRESPKVLDTKLNKEIYLMALVKNQRYSKNSKNN